mmetsp:Transcript_5369/g.12629  ORF Transcript_5369/g.12629 Transcript_5369/m.12629 type:complete len:259 (-) Transcript_5369:739-1515(-)
MVLLLVVVHAVQHEDCNAAKEGQDQSQDHLPNHALVVEDVQLERDPPGAEEEDPGEDHGERVAQHLRHAHAERHLRDLLNLLDLCRILFLLPTTALQRDDNGGDRGHYGAGEEDTDNAPRVYHRRLLHALGIGHDTAHCEAKALDQQVRHGQRRHVIFGFDDRLVAQHHLPGAARILVLRHGVGHGLGPELREAQEEELQKRLVHESRRNGHECVCAEDLELLQLGPGVDGGEAGHVGQEHRPAPHASLRKLQVVLGL